MRGDRSTTTTSFLQVRENRLASADAVFVSFELYPGITRRNRDPKLITHFLEHANVVSKKAVKEMRTLKL